MCGRGSHPIGLISTNADFPERFLSSGFFVESRNTPLHPIDFARIGITVAPFRMVQSEKLPDMRALARLQLAAQITQLLLTRISHSIGSLFSYLYMRCLLSLSKICSLQGVLEIINQLLKFGKNLPYLFQDSTSTLRNFRYFLFLSLS